MVDIIHFIYRKGNKIKINILIENAVKIRNTYLGYSRTKK